MSSSIQGTVPLLPLPHKEVESNEIFIEALAQIELEKIKRENSIDVLNKKIDVLNTKIGGLRRNLSNQAPSSCCAILRESFREIVQTTSPLIDCLTSIMSIRRILDPSSSTSQATQLTTIGLSIPTPTTA